MFSFMQGILWLLNKYSGCEANVIRPQFITPRTTETRGEVFENIHFKLGWTCRKYKKKSGMKIRKETTLLENNGIKDTQEYYLTSAAYTVGVG